MFHAHTRSELIRYNHRRTHELCCASISYSIIVGSAAASVISLAPVGLTHAYAINDGDAHTRYIH